MRPVTIIYLPTCKQLSAKGMPYMGWELTIVIAREPSTHQSQRISISSSLHFQVTSKVHCKDFEVLYTKKYGLNAIYNAMRLTCCEDLHVLLIPIKR